MEKKGKVLSPDPPRGRATISLRTDRLFISAAGILHWYQGARVPRIGLAIGFEETRTTRTGSHGPRGSWDERGVADPYVIKIGDYFYMYFLGQDRARRQRLGVARSKDGVIWTKYRGNPILELGAPGRFDDTGFGRAGRVVAARLVLDAVHGVAIGKNTGGSGLARSRDGVNGSRQ